MPSDIASYKVKNEPQASFFLCQKIMTASAVMLTQEALANHCSQNTGGDGTGAAAV